MPIDAVPPPGSGLVPVFLKIPPENIVALKDVIESYEGVGVVRTIDPHSGEIVVLALEDTIEDIRGIIRDLEQELGIKVVPPPAAISGDWLLSEEYGSSPEKA